ncbi:dipeptidase [Micrococcus terreus]|uniref:dipeptidase n=1 Tax=Micrococcus terreus TaxID=574650 RepID=UPI0021A5400D|nr:dipeptidase [Micrococcus terreus]MCT2090295.1 dipeptidase [Micrococcus terreus]MDK7699969.1 dipeptidase [Micrococcus terreus]WOO98355.1 dipeptidase [Micrococcus terreus]
MSESSTSQQIPATAAEPLSPQVHQSIAEAVDRQLPRTIQTLTDLVSIPGIAWDSFDREPLERSAQAVAELLRGLGLQDVQILTEDKPADATGEVRPGGPAVVGTRPASPGKPTVLLYAHHDVQPTGDTALWETDPFTAVEKDGRLYGRGAADDKAGIMVHIAALQALLASENDTGVGVTFFIEGEEEAGSPTFRTFLEAHRDRLQADVIVVADSSNWKVGVPALTTSLRGLVDGVFGVRVLEHAVHSGMYGGPVLDAPTLLARLIATLHDDEGNVAIAGLEQTQTAAVDYPEQDFRVDASVLESVRLAGTGPLADRLWNRAALSIIGTDVPQIEVSSNTIQPVARAKFSLRLGAGMDPAAAMTAIESHLKAQDVFGAEVFFEAGETGLPFHTDTAAPAAQAMLASLQEAWGVEPVETGIGGSIPFTADLMEVFPEATILVTGVEDPDSRAHSANESLHLGDFRHAIVAEALLLARLGAE